MRTAAGMRGVNLRSRRIAKGTLAALVVICSALAPGAELSADLILDNGEIRTPEGWASVLAVRAGVIIAIGDSAAVLPFKSVQTKLIDLHGAAVLPGLHDLHVHPASAGQAELGCKFAQGTAPAAILEAVRNCASSRTKGEWIVGGQWDANSFGKRAPDRKQLDAVAPDNPVVLSDVSLHSMWLNSPALALAGITKATPNPEGGVIERDVKGEPTGVIRETARVIVRRAIPPFTAEENAKALGWSLSRMLSYGITSFTDAAGRSGT